MFTVNFPSRSIDERALHSEGIKMGMLPWEQEVVHFMEHWADGPETMTVQTSGSTGTPKRIALHTAMMHRSAEITCRFFDLFEGSRTLLCLPVRYIAGKMMVIRAMTHGWNMDAVSPSLVPIPSGSPAYDFVAMTPLQVARNLDANPVAFRNVKTLLIGGAPTSFLLRKRLQEEEHTRCFASYGMTETASHVAVQRLNGPEQSDAFHALPGYVFGLDNRHCLAINFGHRTGNVIITNDRIELLDSSTFRWIGRADNIINSGGVKVFPGRVEAILGVFMDRDFYISGRKDPDYGEQVVMVIEGAPYTSDQEAELWEDLRDLLNPFQVPKALIYENEFERTETGKIKRQRY